MSVPLSTPFSLTVRATPRLATLMMGAVLLLPFTTLTSMQAQAPAAAAAPNPNIQRGTVKAISGSILTVTTDTGKSVTVNVADTAKVVQLAPGSTDLKTASAAALTDVTVGDRVLLTGKPADAPDTFNAARVILMKSGDIADRQTAQKADWQRRGSGGLVSAIDSAAGTITVTNGTRKTTVTTSPATLYRRYASDSIKFEDAHVGTMAQIEPGDQVRVRGAKSEDGASVAAEEIVSGSFRNISATISSIDATSGTVTVKDLATKKTVIVKVTANSEVKALPAMMATRLAAMNSGAAAGGAAGAGSGGGRPAGAEGGASAGGPPQGGGRPAGMAGGAGGYGGGAGGPGGGGGRAGGGDLSTMVARLPQGTLVGLKPGDALMIVGSQTEPGATTITAITLLSGVEPLLTKTGAPTMQLTPWSMGGGAGAAGGEGGGGGQ